MSECVLDANVLVASFDQDDSLHERAQALLERLEREGVERFVFLDVLVAEAISVVCRRFRERKRSADLPAVLERLRQRFGPSTISWVSGEIERLYGNVLEIVVSSEGRLNFNDALLVALQREGRIDTLATFDAALLGRADFRTVTG